MTLPCQRALFDIPDDVCYLNSAYMGPLPKPVHDAASNALRLRSQPWNILSDGFFTPAERVRVLAGALMNASPEHIAFVPHVANATAILAKNISLRAGQRIVTLSEQFPSNLYPWRNFREQGVEVHMVGVPDGPNRAARWSDAALEAITPNTGLVAVETAHWTDGTLFDLARIGERCKQVGAWFAIDATQTAGVEPIDLGALQPDLFVVHPYKSMLCNYGLGFAYFGERLANGLPLEESWLMRAGSEDFARLVDYQDAYAPGMRRYDTSLRANPQLILMLEAALTLFQQWQPARVRDYCTAITQPFAERMRQAGYTIAPEAERARNIFGIRPPAGTNLEAVRARLAQNKVYVSVRGSAIRVSPHVYNTEADLMRLADVLQAA
jgi:selenocysteine lyase/cysteine desulfurase